MIEILSVTKQMIEFYNKKIFFFFLYFIQVFFTLYNLFSE